MVLWPLLLAASRPSILENVYAEGEEFELRIFLSSKVRFAEFNETEALVWHEKGIAYSLAEKEHSTTVSVPVTPHLYANGSLFAHVFATKAGKSPDPKAGNYDRLATTFIVKPLVSYDARAKPIGLKKLITGEPAPWEDALMRGAADAVAAGRPDGEYISYWKPALHLQLVIDTEMHVRGEMPALYEMYLQSYRLFSGHRYKPLLYNNELTVMRQHWMALNATLRQVPLEITYKPLPLRRFQWMVNLENSFKMNEENLGLSEKDSEDMRGMFVNTNPYLLYTTVAVSTVHLLFDMLAFKSDISFWSSVDTMEGLSSRSLLLNEAMELIILLYLIEEDSSWLIKITSVRTTSPDRAVRLRTLCPCASVQQRCSRALKLCRSRRSGATQVFTLVLGLFKISKSLSVKRRDAAKAQGGVSVTDEYDRLAFKFLLPPLLLLVVGYALHSLVTCYFRSWYSWLLESLVALVYGCGFIVMTPQLFINYRLKSVAHLPWKFFMYKALNTFIDDLFAFIIKMPTLHRMSCFRDDVVFAVFLYQRWIYKVDLSRVNEFGQRGEDETVNAPLSAQAPAAAASTSGAPRKAAKSKETAAERKRK